MPANKSGLQSESIFNLMSAFLQAGHGPSIIPKVKATFAFNILKKKGGKPVMVWDIDLKNGNGHVIQQTPKNPDAVFSMTDADFVKLCDGKMNGSTAFMQGKMKIKGNMAAATKFTPELFPSNTPENMAKYGGAKL